MNTPFLTLITPVYNIERLISHTIDSALEQTFTDWEMILIDDGSPDHAGEICDEYASRDSRIKVVHKKNAGLAAARNTGIENAKGKYFWIYEGSDLFYSKDTLQDIYQDLVNEEVDIYFGLLQDMMEKGWEVTNVQNKYCVDGFWNEDGRNLFIKLYVITYPNYRLQNSQPLPHGISHPEYMESETCASYKPRRLQAFLSFP